MNIIYKEHAKLSYYKAIQQVTKSNGYCYSNYKWLKCSYWRCKNKKYYCKLFTDSIHEGESLHVCNVIYSLDFIGDP